MSKYILERSKIMFDEVNKYEQGLIERGEISNKPFRQPTDIYKEIPAGGVILQFSEVVNRGVSGQHAHINLFFKDKTGSYAIFFDNEKKMYMGKNVEYIKKFSTMGITLGFHLVPAHEIDKKPRFYPTQKDSKESYSRTLKAAVGGSFQGDLKLYRSFNEKDRITNPQEIMALQMNENLKKLAINCLSKGSAGASR